MFRHVYQSGLLSVFYSLGSDPLGLWATKVHEGKISRLMDSEIESPVLEISSENIKDIFIITLPSKDLNLGIKLPYLVLIVKNVDKYFSFEVEIKDKKGSIRRFRASNFQTKPRVLDEICTMPLRLEEGWNHVTLDLSALCRRAYSTYYAECNSIQIHANCRLRRVYFSETLYTEDQLPIEFRLFLPVQKGEHDDDDAATDSRNFASDSQPQLVRMKKEELEKLEDSKAKVGEKVAVTLDFGLTLKGESSSNKIPSFSKTIKLEKKQEPKKLNPSVFLRPMGF